MEISIPDIYTVGDTVQVKHYVTGEDMLNALAGLANKQGSSTAELRNGYIMNRAPGYS